VIEALLRRRVAASHSAHQERTVLAHPAQPERGLSSTDPGDLTGVTAWRGEDWRSSSTSLTTISTSGPATVANPRPTSPELLGRGSSVGL
jgi:hypothetical protein